MGTIQEAMGTTMPENAVVFRSAAQRARAATLFFWASIIVSMLVAATTLWQFSLWGRIGSGTGFSVPEAEFSDAVSMGLGLLDIGLLVGTAISFLMWFHRVRTNLPPLGIADARWSPGWAVGWWFVPVMSLFRPYQVAAEIWRASDPAATPAGWHERPVAAVLGWWWALFVASTIVEQVSFRLWMRVDDDTATEFMQNLALVDTAAALLNVIGAWLAIRVVAEIERRQNDRVRLQAFA